MPRQPNGRPAIFKGADGWHHTYVTVGTKPNGKPDRRHIQRRTGEEVSDAIDELHQRLTRRGGAPARVQTVEDWLRHWLDNVVQPAKPQTTYRGYKSLIDNHVTPAIGAWRLDGSRKVLQPEHIEAMYAKLRGKLAPSTILKIHRVLSKALKDAVRRGKAARNVCELIDSPTARRKRIESYALEDAQALLVAAAGDPMEARWLVGLLLGPRQGETLGLRWPRVQLAVDEPYLQLAKQLQRYTWRHGCADPVTCAKRKCKTKPCRDNCKRHTRACPPPCPSGCTKHASTCPQRRDGGLVEVDLKSEGSDRDIALPPPVVDALRRRREAQMRECQARGVRWDDKGFVFTQPSGRPVDPRRDYAAWKALTERAGVPVGRLHAARHTAATLLLATGTDIATVQEILGHSDIRVTRGYVDIADKQKREAVNRLAQALIEGRLTDLLQPSGKG
jgi:integrase